jgi:hypothetical protein
MFNLQTQVNAGKPWASASSHQWEADRWLQKGLDARHDLLVPGEKSEIIIRSLPGSPSFLLHARIRWEKTRHHYSQFFGNEPGPAKKEVLPLRLHPFVDTCEHESQGAWTRTESR